RGGHAPTLNAHRPITSCPDCCLLDAPALAPGRADARRTRQREPPAAPTGLVDGGRSGTPVQGTAAEEPYRADPAPVSQAARLPPAARGQAICRADARQPRR